MWFSFNDIILSLWCPSVFLNCVINNSIMFKTRYCFFRIKACQWSFDNIGIKVGRLTDMDRYRHWHTPYLEFCVTVCEVMWCYIYSWLKMCVTVCKNGMSQSVKIVWCLVACDIHPFQKCVNVCRSLYLLILIMFSVRDSGALIWIDHFL